MKLLPPTRSMICLFFLFLLNQTSFAQVKFRSKADNIKTFAETSFTIAKPANTEPGDVLIFCYSTSSVQGLAVSPATAGWTKIKEAAYPGDPNALAAVYYKIAGLNEPSTYTFPCPNGAMAVGSIMSFWDVYLTDGTPFDVMPGDFLRSTSTYSLGGSITTQRPNSAVLMLTMNRSSRAHYNSTWSATSPSALNEIVDEQYTDFVGQASIGAAWNIKPIPGETGQGAVEVTGSSESFGLFLALKSKTPRPAITSISPTVGPVGNNVLISGSNFNTDVSKLSVQFGATKANIISNSATSLNVSVPGGSTFENICVTDSQYHYSAFTPKSYNVTFDEGSMNFDPKIFFANSGSWTYSLAACDFDGDGKPDLANTTLTNDMVNIFSSTVSSGTSSFGNLIGLTTGDSPSAIATGDINGDGKPDIVTANENSNTVSLFINTSAPGNISFASKLDFDCGGAPRGIAIADMDADGRADVVVANFGQNTMAVLRNVCSPKANIIGLAAPVHFQTDVKPTAIAVADINGDGKKDVVIANYEGHTLSVYRNTSTGISSISFATRVTLPTESYPRALAVEDIDGDGKPDIATVNYTQQRLSLYRNLSSGNTISFAARELHFSGENPTAIRIGDIDGDGKNDITVTTVESRMICLYKNNSVAGAFTIAPRVDINNVGMVSDIILVDINLDGKNDICVTDLSNEGINIYQQSCSKPEITAVSPLSAPPGSSITITGTNFTNTGTVSFGGVNMVVSNWSATSITATTPLTVFAGDIVVANKWFRKDSFFYSIPPKITSFSPQSGAIGTSVNITGNYFNTTADQNIVYFGPVRATVTAATATQLTVTVPPGANYQYITVTNLTGNATVYSVKPFIVTLSGSITFKPKVDFAIPTSAFQEEIVSGDLDGDGKPDLAIGTAKLSIFPNNSSNGTLTLGTRIDINESNNRVKIADLDGDGKMDLISGGAYLGFYRNTSTGPGNFSFAPRLILYTYSDGTVGDFVVGDIDGDGKPDVAALNSFNILSVFKNTSTPGNLNFARIDMNGASACKSAKLCDMDGDGKPDLVLSSNINTFKILRNLSVPGTFSFASGVEFNIGSNSRDLATGDLDGDGKPDVAVVNTNSNNMSVLLNQSTAGSLRFATKQDFALGILPKFLAIGDINGDGKPDIATTNDNSTFFNVFRNNSTPGTLSLTKTDFTTGGYSQGIVFGDINLDNKPDLSLISLNTLSVFQQDCTAPAIPTLSTTSTTNCGAQNTTLSIIVGALNNATEWKWYSGSCGGTSIGTGTSVTVSPTVTTTYYVRGEGSCVTAGECASITITVNTGTTYYVDADGDGYGSTTTASFCSSTAPEGYSANNTDCNDSNPNIHAAITYYLDADGDGYGSTTTGSFCSLTAPAGYSANNTDCNDSNPNIHAAITYYLDVDGDGYGSTTTGSFCSLTAPAGYSANNTDCNDSNPNIHAAITYYLDADGDGYGSTTTGNFCSLTAPAGYSANNTDCNDSNPNIHAAITYYLDVDGDGYGSTTTGSFCSLTAPAGYSANNTDCNDSNPNIHAAITYYLDADGDGYGSTTTGSFCSLTAPAGYSASNTDCNDNDNTIYPGATEICDGKDNDCDGSIDEGFTATTTYYRDADGDGYGNAAITTTAKCVAPAGYVTDNTDCNDNDAGVHAPTRYYTDADKDGYGITSNKSVLLCTSVAPAGYSIYNTDCNDKNASINPGAVEICDGIDNNCDGQIDENCPQASLSINDVSIAEGNTGKKTLTFTVTLSQASTKAITVSYTTADGTATAPPDYVAKSGTLTFRAGTTTQQVAITIVADKTTEANETFNVVLSSPTNTIINDGSGTGTILNDDGSGAQFADDTDLLTRKAVANQGSSEATSFSVKAFNNPSASGVEFNLQVQSNSKEDVQLIATNMYGQKVLVLKGGLKSNYRFGANWIAGTYIIQVVQGKNIKTLKLIKQ